MTIMSMTGYGRSEVEIEDRRLLVEVRSVNHRFLEMSIKLPYGWLVLEENIRKELKKEMRRGRVELSVSLDGQTERERELHFDESLFEKYLDIQEKLTAHKAIVRKLTMGDLLRHSALWHLEESSEDLTSLEQPVLEAVQIATYQMKQMRAKEGQALAADLVQRCHTLINICGQIENVAPQVVDRYRKRLIQRIQELTAAQQIDQDRLMTEVALFAEKSDITEECTRLASHLQQFQSALTMQEPVGRRLDFLIQEMLREVNTIGSKANDQTIGHYVIQSKSELEKMKE